jgi:hypothetical protein
MNDKDKVDSKETNAELPLTPEAKWKAFSKEFDSLMAKHNIKLSAKLAPLQEVHDAYRPILSWELVPDTVVK